MTQAEETAGLGGMSDNDMVTAQSGKQVAYEWAKRQGLADHVWQSQRKRYSKLLADRCVAEAVRVGEVEWELWDRLTEVGEILEAIKYACAIPVVRSHWQVEDVPVDKSAEYLRANEIVWVRHDVSRVYEQGYEASGYPGVERARLADGASGYLERPWLRLAALDWLLVDAFVTDEVARYGESLKAAHIPGPSDPIKAIELERRTMGNLAAMEKAGRRYRPRPVLYWLTWQIGMPVAAVGTAVWLEAWKTAAVLVVLTVLDFAFIGIKLSIYGLRRLRATPEQRRTRKQNDYRRFGAMIQVHRLLEGPVVSPRLVREEMVKSTDLGAV